ncbi:MAG: hypothetical protein HN509_17900 [Halobacteriovoraceae bacterium]|jgi:hypothetical protein|nr:hypothetical protein [Halobacteriovoraceae bacterium]MBT5092641.1 hypothetical protein [Halobacteriovoraceae bacterium]
MAEIINIAEFFLLSIALGVGFFSFIASPSLTGSGFTRLITVVCFSALSGATLLHISYASAANPQVYLSLLALGAFALTYFFKAEKSGLVTWTLFIIQNAAIIWRLAGFNNFNGQHFLFSFSSVLMTGIITYAMLLGHWYLVVPKLSEAPLKRAVKFIWLILIAKIIWSGLTLFGEQQFLAEGTRLGSGYAFNWLMVLMRIGWGYVIIGVMSIFVWKLVKMRSIQSATGIFYAMTFFVFTSETISFFLFFRYGVFV